MALVVQDDSGTVADANAYVTVAAFKAYHDDRGNSYGSPIPADAVIEKAIVKATDYIDQRFNYKGVRQQTMNTQTTAWPRSNVVDTDGNWVSGIPLAVKNACCEYALRALSSTLNPDPVSPDDSGYRVKSIKKVAGPVSKEIEYDNSGPNVALPRYPSADRLLVAAGLIASSSQLARG